MWQDILKKKPFHGYNKKIHHKKGGLNANGKGGWSGNKAMIAAKEYKKAGGGYK